MKPEHFHCLSVLVAERDFSRAAERCGKTEADVREAVDMAQSEFGIAMLDSAEDEANVSFTQDGLRVLAWAGRMNEACASLRLDLADTKRREAVKPLTGRRSISPKRLGLPGPSAEDIEQMLRAALRAPDHGGLHPWRVIEFTQEQRAELAECFVQEKLRRDPLASADDLARARQHATRPPVLLAFVVSPVTRSRTPQREQWLGAGAALGNLLNAAHQLGFGAITLSGERCYDKTLAVQLGLGEHEFVAGFISMGSILSMPGKPKVADPAVVHSVWGATSTSQAGPAMPAQKTQLLQDGA